MPLRVRLLGPPAIEIDGRPVAGPRGNKAWGLLAYLLLSDLRPTRHQLARLLFADAKDPLGALRWNLSELRRSLGTPDSFAGERPQVALPDDCVVDVWTLTGAQDLEEAELEGIGAELLEGMGFTECATFESWLSVERNYLAGASEALLHERASERLGEGRTTEAVRVATRLVSLNPFDEAHQELLVRSLQRSGNVTGALAQAEACEEIFLRELGIEPSPAVRRAARPSASAPPSDRVSARMQLEAGIAQVAAGAVETGLDQLRQACSLTRADDDPALRAEALVALGSALVHAVRGRDEEGALLLREAVALAEKCDVRPSAVIAMRELGHVAVHAGRRSQAVHWLSRAESIAECDEELGPILVVQGMSLSDTGDYPAALERLEESVERAEHCGDRRQAAFALSILGRTRLLRGELAEAREAVDRSLEQARAESWIAFRPLPETLLGELDLHAGKTAAAEERLQHAFALACQVGDPCWEGLSARALGLLEVARGQADQGRGWMEEARARCTRVADRYEWIHGHILDSLAGLAVEQGDSAASALVENLAQLAGRTSMRELTVRSMVHRGRLDRPDALEAARVLAAEIENPELDRLLATAA